MQDQIKNLRELTLKAEQVPGIAIAFCFVLLALLAGLAAGGRFAVILSLSLATVCCLTYVQVSGWLLSGSQPGVGPTAKGSLITGVLLAIAALFVSATGGAHSPLVGVLCLPIILAFLCFRPSVGFISSLIAAVFYAVAAGWPAHHLEWPNSDAVSVSVGFVALAFLMHLLAGRLTENVNALNDKANELTALLDMSQMMDTATDLETTLDLILLNVGRLTGCDAAAVYLKDTSGDHLELRATSGGKFRMTSHAAIRTDDTKAAGWNVARTGLGLSDAAVYYVPRAASGPPRLSDLNRAVGSYACVALECVDGFLGMLYIGYERDDALRPEDQVRLANLAHRVASSLQRALLHQGVRSLAYSDALTGLPNFRNFEQSLSEEVRRASRYDHPVSLLLMDIDHFKSFNDRLGHQAGDALLSQLATVLRDSLRSVDRPARYGGEEFAVICPETGEAEARMIGDRIRANVEKAVFSLLDAEADADTAGVTVSVGCAEYPGNAMTARELVKCADDALYAAKADGRNLVRCCSDLREPFTLLRVEGH